MKKIIFFLLCTVTIYGQTYQNPTYGTVTEKNNATDNTPAYFTTTQVDGVHKKTPAALIAKTATVNDSLATKENVANKSDSYTASSSTTYSSTKALVDGLATKQNTITNPTTGVGSQNDQNTYALQDGTILYHSTKWFVPTGTVSTSGTTVTSVGTQFASNMVGAKLIINGEWRIITGYTSSTVVTVASAYSQDYSGVVAGSWGVYSRSYISRLSTVLDYQSQRFFDRLGKVVIGIDDSIVRFEDLGQQSLNSLQIYADGIFLGGSRVLQWSSNTSGLNEIGGTKDLGLRRNTAGVLEIYDGVTADGAIGNRRDLLARNITATNYNGSATLTGTPTAPTATAGTNTTQIATTAFVQASARPYKVYTALLLQSGTNAPTVYAVLENNIGTVTWTRGSAGVYYATTSGLFTIGKTVGISEFGDYTTAAETSRIYAADSSTVILATNVGGNATDGLLTNAFVEIRVYN